jgi:hypothetical protein
LARFRVERPHPHPTSNPILSNEDGNEGVVLFLPFSSNKGEYLVIRSSGTLSKYIDELDEMDEIDEMDEE